MWVCRCVVVWSAGSGRNTWMLHVKVQTSAVAEGRWMKIGLYRVHKFKTCNFMSLGIRVAIYWGVNFLGVVMEGHMFPTSDGFWMSNVSVHVSIHVSVHVSCRRASLGTTQGHHRLSRRIGGWLRWWGGRLLAYLSSSSAPVWQ